MLKKSLLVSLALLLAFSLSAFAGEGSDTVGGGKLLPQLRYGFSATEWDTNSAVAGTLKDWDFEAHSYYLQVNWGVFENVDLIALVGGRSMSLDAEYATDFAESDDPIPMFMWGLGVKGTFFRADNGFYVGGGALFTHSFAGDFDLRASGGNFRPDLSIYTITPELHAGWHIGDTGLTPYLGVDYTWGRAISEFPTGQEIEYQMDEPFYMFVGLDHYVTDRLYLNFEGRMNFADGWGIDGGVGYLFDICAPAPAPEPAPAPVIEPKLEPMSKN